MTEVLNVRNEALQQQIDHLSAMVDSLNNQLAELRAVAVPSAPPAAVDQAEPSSSRRHLLKLAGGAAAAAVAGGVLLDGARPAAANTGDNLIVGVKNYAQSMTRINNSALNKPNEVTSLLTTEKTLFWADNRASSLLEAVGVRGDGRDNGTGIDGYGGTGVRGTGLSSTPGASTGVAGTGDTGVRGTGDSVGIVGLGSGPSGFGVGAIGKRAALLLQSGTGSQPPNRTDADSAGEIDIDANGTTWVCVKDGTPGTWRKIAGDNTAGAFHPISPVRAFDSRWTGNTRLNSGANKVVSVADAHDLNGVVTTPDVVLPGATAIAYNLTVTNTAASGFLSSNPGDATVPTSSSINWFGDNQNIANGLIVGLDATRQIKVFCGGGGSTDFVVDVTGYFR